MIFFRATDRRCHQSSLSRLSRHVRDRFDTADQTGSTPGTGNLYCIYCIALLRSLVSLMGYGELFLQQAKRACRNMAVCDDVKIIFENNFIYV